MAHCEGKYCFVKLSCVSVHACLCRVEMCSVVFVPALEIHIECTFYKSMQLVFSSYHHSSQWGTTASWCLNLLIGIYAFYHLLFYFFNYRNHFLFRFLYNSFVQLEKWVWFSWNIHRVLYHLMDIGLKRSFGELSWLRAAHMILDK